MATRGSPDTERRALALFERLFDRPGDMRLRDRLLRHEPGAVRARVAALEASAVRAAGAIPTLVPGSGDCDGAALPPHRLGAFRLADRIGRGGMGEVWLASRDDGLYEQKVAIKLIQRRVIARAGGAFDDERRFLARLEHPNIARLIDGGMTEDGLHWLAMEYIDGQPIDQACAGRPTADRVGLFVKAADAVQYAHAKMVAHADLKPANIMVDAAGRVKLLDFGIAGLIGEGPRSFIGSGPLTREFASPERLAGGGPSVADDVHALGRTLQLVLGGSGDRELAAIAAKALQPDEADRYTSAAAMIADLDRWRARLPVAALRDSWRYRTSKFVQRHRRGVAATAAAMLLLCGATVFATASWMRAERNRQVAEQRFGQVRHLSRFMLFDMYDQLAREPGTVAKRAEIARTAAGYLDRLRVAADAPADLRLETARSYRRLATIQGLPGVSNLGQPEAAATSLAKADALLAGYLEGRPRDAYALAERGWVATERWTLAADNAGSPRLNRIAQRYFDAALRHDPRSATAALGRIAVARNQGYDLIWSANQPARALPILKGALARLRAARWPAALTGTADRLEINLLNRIGDATYYAGDIPGSLTAYRESDALIDEAIARDGAVPQRVIAKGEQAFNISGALGDIAGREVEALAVAKAGIDRLKLLLASGPDAAAEKWLLVLYGQQALVLQATGRLDAALIPSAASIGLRDARLAASPGNPQRMRDVGIGLLPHAELLARAGRAGEACAAATRAEAVWRAIRHNRNLSAFDATKNLPRSQALRRKLCAA